MKRLASNLWSRPDHIANSKKRRFSHFQLKWTWLFQKKKKNATHVYRRNCARSKNRKFFQQKWWQRMLLLLRLFHPRELKICQCLPIVKEFIHICSSDSENSSCMSLTLLSGSILVFFVHVVPSSWARVKSPSFSVALEIAHIVPVARRCPRF